MKILTVDIGTGTQDIFLYDSRLDLENGFKLIVPSPTMIVHRKLKEATRAGQAVLLRGVTMGGGPSQWAAEAHARAGLPVYALPEAAKSFNDDLEAVREMGIRVLSEDEARQLPEAVVRVEMADFDMGAIARAFEGFGVRLDDLAAVAVAVFDHGNAPVGYSDRQFRFDYLDERIRTVKRLSAFAHRAEDIPESMTRLQAVARSARGSSLLEGVPLVAMDTAPAAVLGATFDPRLQEQERLLVANVGNFHTLAFRLGPGGIEGAFEHHTGLIDRPRLEALLEALADGSLRHEQVFGDHGHGALIYEERPFPLHEMIASQGFGAAVTGPRRGLMGGSALRPYFAAPFGDMMVTGCFGMLAAAADLLPELAEPIHRSLQGKGDRSSAPWEI